MNDDDLFRQMMGEVTPLSNIERRISSGKSKKKQNILRQFEAKDTQRQHHALQQNPGVQRVETYLLRADGVSSKDIKKLANMSIQHELDLHGHTQAQAEQALNRFFQHATARQIRYLCVVHGKGKHSKNQTSVLKDFTFQWLAHGSFSHAILIATLSSQSGGGACNILLRKSK